MTLGPPLEEADHQGILSYRLGQVETAVRMNNEQVNRKLDTITGIATDVSTLKLRVESLEKSRDRQIALTTTLLVGLVLLAIQIIFGVA